MNIGRSHEWLWNSLITKLVLFSQSMTTVISYQFMRAYLSWWLHFAWPVLCIAILASAYCDWITCRLTFKLYFPYMRCCMCPCDVNFVICACPKGTREKRKTVHLWNTQSSINSTMACLPSMSVLENVKDSTQITNTVPTTSISDSTSHSCVRKIWFWIHSCQLKG